MVLLAVAGLLALHTVFLRHSANLLITDSSSVTCLGAQWRQVVFFLFNNHTF